MVKNTLFQGPDVQLGSVIGLGYLIGQYLNVGAHSSTMEVDGTSKIEEDIKSVIIACLQKLGLYLIL